MMDYPHPRYPDRVGIPRYEDLPNDQRSMSQLQYRLKTKIQRARELVEEFQKARDKRLGFGDKMFRKKKWKAVREREYDVPRALLEKHNKHWVTGAYYLARFGWFDGDALFYYDFAVQLRRLDNDVLMSLKRWLTYTAMEVAEDEISQLIQTIHLILQAISDAYADFYERLRPSWRPRTLDSLPSPFCPLALAIQRNTSYPVRLIEPLPGTVTFRFKYWMCPECSGLCDRCPDTTKVNDPQRAPFVTHLRAKQPNEIVKHACPDCLKVVDNLDGIHSHVFMKKWENWTCGPPPLTLSRLKIGTPQYLYYIIEEFG